MGKNEIGLYIHIPFCKAKCYYCDFNSYAGRDKLIPAYFNALKNEMESYGEKIKGYTVKTIFIGGGTPSFVEEKNIYEIMKLIFSNANVDSCAEISIEANPGTLSREKLHIYRESGINRISIGLQAWQDSILKGIGRIHSAREFTDNLKYAREEGFTNINADLIFGLPGQTIGQWKETLSKVLEQGVEHLSCYSLKIEEGTVFGDKLDRGELQPAEDELDREMYHLAIDMLKRNGFNHYEISNFSKPGYESKHNLVYWNADPYIGLGAGAHSYFDGKRYNNIYPVEQYISYMDENKPAVENMESISKKDSMSEFMILGLRLIEGISVKHFENKYNEDVFNVYGKQLKELSDRKLIIMDGDNIRLSPQGIDLANMVFVEFI